PSSLSHASAISDTAAATTAIDTLSLHDALPIFKSPRFLRHRRIDARNPSVKGFSRKRFHAQIDGDAIPDPCGPAFRHGQGWRHQDRKSTRLNSSHVAISYAVFCLKKKKKTNVAH